MKTILRSLVALSIMLFSFGAYAQNANDLLNEVYNYGQDAESHSNIAENVLNSFATNYFVLGNTNTDVDQFVTDMQLQMSIVESASDEIIYYAREAGDANTGLDVSGLVNKGSQIEALEDYIQNAVQAIRTNINAGNLSQAQFQVVLCRAYLNQQQDLAMQVLNEAAGLEAYYDVRIVLVDNNGNVVTSHGIQGYSAYDMDNNQYYYPQDYYTPNEFENLGAGTYRFDAMDGYFDGASSKIVTLSNSMVGTDGYITIELQYWSE